MLGDSPITDLLRLGSALAHSFKIVSTPECSPAFAEFEKIHTPPFGCEIPSFQVTAFDRDGLVVVLRPHFSVVPFYFIPPYSLVAGGRIELPPIWLMRPVSRHVNPLKKTNTT